MTDIFEAAPEHEAIVVGQDPASGLRAIIAVHSTALGPALGGLRIRDYQSEREAVADVARLSRGMTLKAAAAGLRLGGGKAVILGDPGTVKTPELLRSFGRLVDRLGGAYVTAADVGTTSSDMDVIAEVTDHVRGVSWKSGDPSPATAHGVFHAIKVACAHRLGSEELDGVHIAIQGVGKVGTNLARRLAAAGAELTLADVKNDAATALATELGARTTTTERIHAERCDVLAPCALGGTLNDSTIPEVRAAIVAGAANNQLAHPNNGEQLHDAGILYAPDFVANAGGLVWLDCETRGYDGTTAFTRVATIGDRLRASRTCRTGFHVNRCRSGPLRRRHPRRGPRSRSVVNG